MGSEILRSKMCYLWSEIWGRQDYLGYDISGMSLSQSFSYYQVFFQNWTADYLGVFEKVVLII